VKQNCFVSVLFQFNFNCADYLSGTVSAFACHHSVFAEQAVHVQTLASQFPPRFGRAPRTVVLVKLLYILEDPLTAVVSHICRNSFENIYSLRGSELL